MPPGLRYQVRRDALERRQVVEVLAGRNWAAEAQSACEGKGEAVGEAKRLDQLPLQDVLEKADHVIDVRLHVLTCALGNRLHAGACRCPCLPVRGGLGCGLKIGTCGWTEQELSNVFPKLASHKFCNSLMARHHKVRTSAPLSLHQSRCTNLAAPLSLPPHTSSLLPRPSSLPPLATHPASVLSQSSFASTRCRLVSCGPEQRRRHGL